MDFRVELQAMRQISAGDGLQMAAANHRVRTERWEVNRHRHERSQFVLCGKLFRVIWSYCSGVSMSANGDSSATAKSSQVISSTGSRSTMAFNPSHSASWNT